MVALTTELSERERCMVEQIKSATLSRLSRWILGVLALAVCIGIAAVGLDHYRAKTARQDAALKLRSAEAMVVAFVRTASGEISRSELEQRALSTCQQLAALTASVDREAVSGTPGLHAAATAYLAIGESFVRNFALARIAESDLSATYAAFKKVDMDDRALTTEALKGFFGMPSVVQEHVALKKAVSEKRATLQAAYSATAESADRLAQAASALASTIRDEAFGQEVDLPRIARWAADEAAQMPK